ncbi:hypothetical protein HR060_14275 [Catenovulum sp. SM1970]|uniref:hypothetical protein n=1 Tax=Marinifaba aquimaris TaxID=2741323 RepID=UPI001571A036|nr:hypothetical protein [Marinifaba aquimaris]NTS78022.1 hypothetical protein [Marinifaba aquimaris]
MLKQYFWHSLLILLVLTSVWDIYYANTVPDILAPVHPASISAAIILLDWLTIFACLGIIRKYYLGSYLFWQLILISQIVVTCLAFYYEISAGGYTFNEILIYGNILFWLAGLFLLPLYKYQKILKLNKAINLS